jgi:hypothetical protein
MDCIVIRCTSEERARLILKANQIIAKLDELREDKTPVNAETVLSKCAFENLEVNLERYMKGMNLI